MSDHKSFYPKFQPSDESSCTDAEKAVDKEYKEFVPEDYDNDGQNDHPSDQERLSITMSGVMIAKGMIGSGILNQAYVHKVLGIFPVLLVSAFVNYLVYAGMYCLMGCKEITQRYGYNVYAKLIMGIKGTIMTKSFIILVGASCCVSYFLIFGDLLRTLSLIFFEDAWYLHSKFLLLCVSLVVMPLMFKKNISALKKFSFMGVIAVAVFLLCITLVFIIKLRKGEIEPINSSMLFPSFKPGELFNAISGFCRGYDFQINTFPIYLPMIHRSSKNMMRALFWATLFVTFLYHLCGYVGYLIYREKIEDSLLLYMREDMVKYLGKENFLAFLLIICQVMYFFNTCISCAMNFFALKNNALNLIELIKGLKSKKSDKEEELKNIDDDNADKKKESISETKQNLMIAGMYAVVVITACLVKSLVVFDAIATVIASNFTMFIFPGWFYLALAKGRICWWKKTFAYSVLLFGLFLIFGFVIKTIADLI